MESRSTLEVQKVGQGTSLKRKREDQSRYAASHSKLYGVRFLHETLLWPILLTPSRNKDWFCDMSEPLYDSTAPGSITKLFSHLSEQTIFIAIDFEGYSYPSELGIPTMDREVLQHIESIGLNELKGLHTLHYQCVNVKRKRKHKAFRFGDTQSCYLEELPSIVEGILKTKKTANGQFSASNIVLVGHGMRSELDILARMGIDLDEAVSIVGILDTKQLAFEIIDFEKLQSGSSLEDIYRLLIHERARSFHNAGNDAEYTLRVLSMLALESIKDMSNLNVVQTARLDALKQLAHSPIPKPREEIRQKCKKKVIPRKPSRNLGSLLFREKIKAREIQRQVLLPGTPT